MRGRNTISHAIDVSRPSVARMYDCFLGGNDNYASDRRACAELLRIAPSTRALARNNRLFLQRVVRVLAEKHGVRQFLDHGSGLPTQDNVHQVAQRVDRSSRVVYIDNDPIVFAHGRALLDENDETAVIQADIANPDAIFGHEDVRRLIDFSRPVAALFVSVLHCLPDGSDPAGVVRRIAARLAPGSFLVICQLTSDNAQIRAETTEFMRQNTHGKWGRVLERHEVDAYFTGMDILSPGLVEISAWHPNSDVTPRQQTHEWIEYGGVGRTR
ncbi:SAM-dependent methyltransferase [Streptomyces sp. NPDC004647]|uniref:SAM-dependent methyltransferase n=1 Tax=Streptomyces sp. NPDC004647 TaxID=3154671 RepID=UPI0033A4B38D